MNVGVDPNIDPQQTLNTSANQLQSHYEKQQQVDETLKPDSEKETKRKEIEVNKFNKETEDRLIDEKIRKIEYYLSYGKSTSYETCEQYLEASKVITNWLDSYNMGFQSLKGVRDMLLPLNQTNPTEFNKLYDDFEKIYTGEMYRSLTTNMTEIIDSFDKTQSFRINMLMLHTKALAYITKNVKTNVSWEKTTYKDFTAYYKSRLLQLKTAYPTMSLYPQFNNVWPTNIVKKGLDVGYSTEHLLLIYVKILQPDMLKYKLIEDKLKTQIVPQDFIKPAFIPSIEKTDEPADVYNNTKVSDDSTIIESGLTSDTTPIKESSQQPPEESPQPIVDESNNTTSAGLFHRIKSNKPNEQRISHKYFLDTNKLNNGVLEIRYNKNRHLTNIKDQIVGHGLKSMIQDIVYNDKLKEDHYHKLTPQEQNTINKILYMLEKTHLISNTQQQFNNKFQILLGEWQAGNNSEFVRHELKQYILHAMNINLITRNLGQKMLLELTLS